MERRFGSFKNYPELWLPVPLEMYMKNRTIQFKATALRCKSSRCPAVAGLLLACLAAVFISVPNPAPAHDQVPFKAGFGTEFESVLEFPFLYISVTGQGNASQLGATSAVTTDQVVDLRDGKCYCDLHVDWGQWRHRCIGDDFSDDSDPWRGHV
jgi:hypothetical protein